MITYKGTNYEVLDELKKDIDFTFDYVQSFPYVHEDDFGFLEVKYKLWTESNGCIGTFDTFKEAKSHLEKVSFRGLIDTTDCVHIEKVQTDMVYSVSCLEDDEMAHMECKLMDSFPIFADDQQFLFVIEESHAEYGMIEIRTVVDYVAIREMLEDLETRLQNAGDGGREVCEYHLFLVEEI